MEQKHLSRVLDKHDRDSMIYSDGAGACIVRVKSEGEASSGIISHATQTFAKEEAYHLFFGNSFDKKEDPDVRYIKMHGRKIYEFALNQCAKCNEICIRQNSGVSIDEVKKVFHSSSK